MTLNKKSQGQGHTERLQLRRSHQGLFPCKVSSLYWLMRLRTNLNAKVNQNYYVTLNRKSKGQGHRERLETGRSYQGLFPCKVSSLYWLMWPTTNLNTEVNQNVDRQTDWRTDRRTSSIHKPELLCNLAKKLWPMWKFFDRQTDRQSDYYLHMPSCRTLKCNSMSHLVSRWCSSWQRPWPKSRSKVSIVSQYIFFKTHMTITEANRSITIWHATIENYVSKIENYVSKYVMSQ